MNYALSPLDGRYAQQIQELGPVFSEYGLCRYRLKVEIEWLIFLSEQGIAPKIENKETLRKIFADFSDENFKAIKDIESKTKHDVKAVEVYLQSQCDEKYHPFIHFGCTSEDINSTAYALMLTEGKDVFNKAFQELLQNICTKSQAWSSVPMLSRTHGQGATPTTVGKEFAVFFSRFEKINERLEEIKSTAKFSGATGNFAAHVIAFPDKNWIELSQEFVEKKLGLVWNPLTTQIEPHDESVALLNEIIRLAGVGIDICRDIWGYISLGYFSQTVVTGEVGSSTMPHKVNPIDFENAEGNFTLSRGIARTLSDSLPISRWQRDLTDSTLQRNYGLVFGHALLAVKSLLKGLHKIEIRPEILISDLESHPEILTEAIQTVMRKHGITDAYDQLKNFSRGVPLSLEKIHEFITIIDIPDFEKKKLTSLTPQTYIGVSVKLVENFLRKG